MRILQAMLLAALGLSGFGYALLSFEQAWSLRDRIRADIAGVGGELLYGVLTALIPLGLFLFLATVGFLALTYLLIGAEENNEGGG